MKIIKRLSQKAKQNQGKKIRIRTELLQKNKIN